MRTCQARKCVLISKVCKLSCCLYFAVSAVLEAGVAQLDAELRRR